MKHEKSIYLLIGHVEMAMPYDRSRLGKCGDKQKTNQATNLTSYYNDHSILVVSHCNIAVTKFQKKTCTQTIGVLFALQVRDKSTSEYIYVVACIF